MRVATSVHAIENVKVIPKIDNPFVGFLNSIFWLCASDNKLEIFHLMLNVNINVRSGKGHKIINSDFFSSLVMIPSH